MKRTWFLSEQSFHSAQITNVIEEEDVNIPVAKLSYIEPS